MDRIGHAISIDAIGHDAIGFISRACFILVESSWEDIEITYSDDASENQKEGSDEDRYIFPNEEFLLLFSVLKIRNQYRQ